MRPRTIMVIAGEASGDLLAAELVSSLRRELNQGEPVPTWDYQPLYGPFEPRFFGAGGPRMSAAGVELAFDLTAHSVIGISDVVKKYLQFRGLFNQLFRLALERQPDAVICVDFGGFNRRFAHALKRYVRSHSDWFHDWSPLLVQYVSPQVWASRPGRAYQIAQDYDLVLSIIPFEKNWYAQRVPNLRVEFVGNPILDRYAHPAAEPSPPGNPPGPAVAASVTARSPLVLLLPGSRSSELARHLPVMLDALEKLRAELPDLRARMVLPEEKLAEQARAFGLPNGLDLRIGQLPQALREATIAIASTGTVTLECAYFGVPTVALYRTSWVTYQIGRRVVTVDSLTMPNLLANEALFPEFIQHAATAENIARAAAELLGDEERRKKIKARLKEVVASLGAPGASDRAARGIRNLFERQAAKRP